MGGVQAAEVCFVGDRRLRAFAIPFESVPPSVSRATPLPEPLRSRRPWRSYPTAPVQPPSSRAGPPQPLALRAPAGPLCGPGHAGRAVGRGRGWGVFASGWGWGCAAGVVAQKYCLFFLFASTGISGIYVLCKTQKQEQANEVRDR